MGNIRIAEIRIGGGISHRLWPASEHLAQFVIDFLDKSDFDEAYKHRGNLDTKGKALYDLQRLILKSKSIDSQHFDLSCADGIASQPLPILELGAGVGLCGIKIATHTSCRVLLTDLEESLSLLHRNIELNKEKFVRRQESGAFEPVAAQRLAWGTNDYEAALEKLAPKTNENEVPILILAADCVYFKELHEPLEHTILSLLSNAPIGSICLIAGARRWKRDNSFYANIGKRTYSDKFGGRLSCVCISEIITRSDRNKTRDVMRVYCIQWVGTKQVRD